MQLHRLDLSSCVSILINSCQLFYYPFPCFPYSLNWYEDTKQTIWREGANEGSNSNQEARAEIHRVANIIGKESGWIQGDSWRTRPHVLLLKTLSLMPDITGCDRGDPAPLCLSSTTSLDLNTECQAFLVLFSQEWPQAPKHFWGDLTPLGKNKRKDRMEIRIAEKYTIYRSWELQQVES